MFRILFALLGMGLSIFLVQQSSFGDDFESLSLVAKAKKTQQNDGAKAERSRRGPDLKQMEANLSPSVSPVENEPRHEGEFDFLEIEVGHASHVFRLLGHKGGAGPTVLHECKVGLGDKSQFPTPVGVYYVTHIFDDDPWWIPPKDRAWAAGDSPSRKVYGGTMAPLLKKRPIRQRTKQTDSEDLISEEVKLSDDGYRFHGTNSLKSIGRNQSHGCVRMFPADAKKVANLIKDYVGVSEIREHDSENGRYVILKNIVHLNLIK
jgi:hypothetical protein